MTVTTVIAGQVKHIRTNVEQTLAVRCTGGWRVYSPRQLFSLLWAIVLQYAFPNLFIIIIRIVPHLTAACCVACSRRFPCLRGVNWRLQPDIVTNVTAAGPGDVRAPRDGGRQGHSGTGGVRGDPC